MKKEAKRQNDDAFNVSCILNVYESIWKKRNPSDFIRPIKYARQRARKGYCDRDIWCFYNWFLDIMPEMLKEFRDSTSGFPDEFMVDEYENNRQDYPHVEKEHLWVKIDDEQSNYEYGLIKDKAFRKWKDAINEIITEFVVLRRMDDEIWEHNSEDEEYFAEMQLHLDKAFALLQRWLFDLWF